MINDSLTNLIRCFFIDLVGNTEMLGYRDTIVTEDSPNLFYQVNLSSNIRTESRYGNLKYSPIFSMK